MELVSKIKEMWSTLLGRFGTVDIDKIDYEGGYVAVAITEDGTKITVYEKEDCSDPMFRYSWENSAAAELLTSGSRQDSYYRLKDYKFKMVKMPTFDGWFKDLNDKETKARELCDAQNPGREVSYVCIAKVIKMGKV